MQIRPHQPALNTLWIIRLLHQTRRRAGHECDVRDALSAVARQITHDLAKARRMRHQGDVTQVECVEQRAEIVGEGVVVVTRPGRVGPAVPSPIHGDAPEAMVDQIRNLEIPHP